MVRGDERRLSCWGRSRRGERSLLGRTWEGWGGKIFIVGLGFVDFSFSFLLVVELGLEDGFLILSDGLREPDVGELTSS